MHVQQISMIGAGIEDRELLATFVRTGAPEPFRILIERHSGWIYAAAWRQLHDRHQAQDATQAVFVLLCQKARSIGASQMISGWLFLALNYTVRSMRRAARRRRIHEARAALEAPKAAGGGHALGESPPLLAGKLDAAVTRLSPPYRAAILLRFYRGCAFPEIARQFGLTEAAARTRVARAVRHLRLILGAPATAENLTAAALFSLPTSQALLSSQITQVALRVISGATAPAGVGAAAKGAMLLMTTSKIKLVAGWMLVATALTISTGVVVWQARTPARGAPAAVPATSLGAAGPYGLSGDEVLSRLAPPFDPARADFIRQHHLNDGTQRDPDAMLIAWRDGAPRISSMRSQDGRSGYNLESLVERLLRVDSFEFEGDINLRQRMLNGDYIIREGATDEQYRAALEKIMSDDRAHPMALIFREVDRPVIVLKGPWKILRPDGQPWDAAKDGPPTIQFDAPTPDVAGAQESNTGDAAAFTAAFAHWMQQTVITEGGEAPTALNWQRLVQHNGPGRDRDLALKYITDQTGLTVSEETRKVRRLFIEPAK